jgi:hypothetical protein
MTLYTEAGTPFPSARRRGRCSTCPAPATRRLRPRVRDRPGRDALNERRRYANKAAGIVCGHFGTAMVSEAEVFDDDPSRCSRRKRPACTSCGNGGSATRTRAHRERPPLLRGARPRPHRGHIDAHRASRTTTATTPSSSAGSSWSATRAISSSRFRASGRSLNIVAALAMAHEKKMTSVLVTGAT